MSTLISAVATLISQYLKVYNERQKLMRSNLRSQYVEFKSGRLLDRKLQPWLVAAVADRISFDHSSSLYIHSANGNFWYKSERVKKNAEGLVGDFGNIAVHPFAKEIVRYMNLKRKINSLTTKQNALRATLQQLSKLDAGVKVCFGHPDKRCAHDRIHSVTLGERTFKPKEFLAHQEFESKILSAE